MIEGIGLIMHIMSSLGFVYHYRPRERSGNRPYSHKDFLKNRRVNRTGKCKIRRAIYVVINS